MRKAMNLMVQRGLTVKTASGWESRGRPYSFNPTAGVLAHHTASQSDIDNVLINGRSDLPGPLCHYALHLDGTVVAIAAGYANHAGESVSGAPSNSNGWGIEATGPYPSNSSYGPSAFPNYNEYTVMLGCILDVQGWPTSKVWGHKESCSPAGRKIDPSFDMDPFRSAIETGGAPGEDDLTPDEHTWLQRIYDAMVVPGSTEPSMPYESNYNRVKSILSALNVPGTTTAEQAVEILYRRVQSNEKYIGELCKAAGIPFTPYDTSTATG
jgi:hypothetical protein